MIEKEDENRTESTSAQSALPGALGALMDAYSGSESEEEVSPQTPKSPAKTGMYYRPKNNV